MLSNWPRLVRWRTQDADSAQLRDQLRQVAHLWIERDRPEDLLWTGTSLKEFELWRERYEGGLSESEEQFAEAMAARAARRRRRRLAAFAAVMLLTLSVAAVTSGLWRQATHAEREARTEAHRAEAQKLLALGETELETWPTVALAHATSSLELADTPEARMLAQRALAAGPPATVVAWEDKVDKFHQAVFSEDGTWAAFLGYDSIQLVRSDGQRGPRLEPFPSALGGARAAFDPLGRYLFGAKAGELRIWSIPTFDLVDRQPLPEGAVALLEAGPERVVSVTSEAEKPTGPGEAPAYLNQVVMEHALGEEPRLVGRFEAGRGQMDVDHEARWLAFASGGELLLHSLESWSEPPRRLGSHGERIGTVAFLQDGVRVATDASQEIRIWSIDPGADGPLRTLPSRFWNTAFGGGDRWLANGAAASDGLWVDLWDLEAPEGVHPRTFSVALPGLGDRFFNGATFAPGGQWLVTGNVERAGFWPLDRREPWILTERRAPVNDLLFTPDGAHLLSRDQSRRVVQWSFRAGDRVRDPIRASGQFGGIALDREGKRLVTARTGGASVVSLDGGETIELEGFDPETWIVGAAIDDQGRLVAASALRGPRAEKVIRIWDLETGDSWTLGPTEDAGDGDTFGISDLAFLPDGKLVSVDGRLRVWSPRGATHEVVASTIQQSQLAVFGEGRYAAYTSPGDSLEIVDLESGDRRAVPSHGEAWAMAVDSTGEILVTGGADGIVRVGRVDGEEPHLLLGHEDTVNTVAISPDARWIASGGQDGTILLWSMPDLSKPPLQALPHDALLARLHSLTNLRLIENPDSPTGWSVAIEPFPGWERVPSW